MEVRTMGSNGGISGWNGIGVEKSLRDPRDQASQPPHGISQETEAQGHGVSNGLV